jgi:mannan endo-1,4-beta-mannosidase
LAMLATGLALVLVGTRGVPVAPRTPPPINRKTTKEAKRLLTYLYSISGKVTLSGEQNQMQHMSAPSDRVQKITGKYPVVWGGEWGFMKEQQPLRVNLLDEIRKQYKAGRVVVMTYHQPNPNIGEPCMFETGVQVPVSDADMEAVLTPGTHLHQVWEEHVDRLANAFLTLQKEHIPVVFRPYHEMNGKWFWWGGRPASFKRLWDMIYDRYVNHFHINNLLWAWTCDRPWPGIEDYFPGLDKVDLLGTDIYPLKGRPEVYPQEWYDRMFKLAAGKPLALSEMAVAPSADVLKTQPFVWFMAWDDMVFSNSEASLKELYNNPQVVSDRIRR